MAALAISLAMLSMLQLGSTAQDYPMLVTARCDNAPDIDWTGTINSYLRRIPETITMRSNMRETWILGFEFSKPELAGLGSLWAYKPAHSFCASNTTFLEAVVFADDPLRITLDWKSCTGVSGKLGTRISSSQMRLYFTAKPTPEGPYRLQLHHIRVDSLEDPRLFATGVSPAVHNFLTVLEIAGMPHLQLFWNRFLRVDALFFMPDAH
ncbi:uncharacterized protein [Dermacentor andersoni]|uniref:uncharacterized protein n=1 Tax=Dermacentor andersoni TaxID=34620 RepID=UPI002416C8EC|nr:uncharacterized protein LOC126533801 [Dermacentor andersoni]XP_054928366.1 uncharacterized protein LOC126533801 [Dermacentor andersoni]